MEDLLSKSQGNLRHLTYPSSVIHRGKNATVGATVEILGDLHLGLSDVFCSEVLFSLAGSISLTIDGKCGQIHLPHATF